MFVQKSKSNVFLKITYDRDSGIIRPIKGVLEEYGTIIAKDVQEKELHYAKSQIRAETAFTRDGSYPVASNLNEAIALGDWTFYTTFLEKIERVTVNDVKRVASKYLKEDQSTTGFFIPTSQGPNAE